MNNSAWGDGPSGKPAYGPGSGTQIPNTKDPFRAADITGSLITAIGVIGALLGLVAAADDATAGLTVVGGSIIFTALGLLLSSVARIGSGLKKAGYIK